MQREIKFRAWSKESKKMIDWDFIHSVRNLHKLMTLNHIELMQFTGLADKNGKEIYEGDVVIPFSKENRMNKSVIVYEFNQFRIKGDVLYWNWDLQQVEVIGNIFE